MFSYHRDVFPICVIAASDNAGKEPLQLLYRAGTCYEELTDGVGVILSLHRDKYTHSQGIRTPSVLIVPLEGCSLAAPWRLLMSLVHCIHNIMPNLLTEFPSASSRVLTGRVKSLPWFPLIKARLTVSRLGPFTLARFWNITSAIACVSQ